MCQEYKTGWLPRCKCEKVCGCMCHTMDGVKHCFPCCGPGTYSHQIFCKGDGDGESDCTRVESST